MQLHIHQAHLNFCLKMIEHGRAPMQRAHVIRIQCLHFSSGLNAYIPNQLRYPEILLSDNAECMQLREVAAHLGQDSSTTSTMGACAALG